MISRYSNSYLHILVFLRTDIQNILYAVSVLYNELKYNGDLLELVLFQTLDLYSGSVLMCSIRFILLIFVRAAGTPLE